MKISVARQADVPDGPLCVNWAYRTHMPPEQNYRCDMLRDESTTVSDREMGGWGSGTSRLTFYRCALFDRSLGYEYGTGVSKCSECKAITEQARLGDPAHG